MTLPSGPTGFGPCFRTPGLSDMSCPTIGRHFPHLKLLLLLGGFPLDRGPLSPCLNPDLDNYCNVTGKTGRCSIMRRDLHGRLACMYDTYAASVIAVPPPPHVATTPTPPPVPTKLACVLLQPWPPPAFLVFGQPLSQESPATCLKASRGGGR